MYESKALSKAGGVIYRSIAKKMMFATRKIDRWFERWWHLSTILSILEGKEAEMDYLRPSKTKIR